MKASSIWTIQIRQRPSHAFITLTSVRPAFSHPPRPQVQDNCGREKKLIRAYMLQGR